MDDSIENAASAGLIGTWLAAAGCPLMIQPHAHRIEDLTQALNRCRKQLAGTTNANAREIYERVITRYEMVIADLRRPPEERRKNAKSAKPKPGGRIS